MSTLEQVKIIVAKQLDKDPATLDETTDLQEAGFESLDVIEMIFNLEDEFKIDIPFNANDTDNSQMSQMRTVADIVRMVETIKASGELGKGSLPKAEDGAPA